MTWRKHAAAMAAIVLVLGVVSIWFGDRIGVNAGQGWDGLGYMHWSDEFWHRVVEVGVTKYQAQRVLPSLLVYITAHPLGVTPTVAHHLVAFMLLDLAMLLGACLLWAHLALRVMGWRPVVAWVGFVALFGSFANARHALYDPVLGDPTAFFLGMLMTWGFLARKPWAVWLAGLFGAFTWPPLWPAACVLLLFPRPREPVAVAEARWTKPLAAVLALCATAFLVYNGFIYRGDPVPDIGDEKLIDWVRGDLLWLTVPLFAAQLATGWYLLGRDRRVWKLGVWLPALAGIAVIYGLRAYWVHKVGTEEGGPTYVQFVGENTLEMLRGPLWGLVHHVVYYGPIVVVALLAWPRVCAVVAEWGTGAAICAATIVAFSAASESRQWIHLFPLLVVLALAATADAWTPRRALVFTALALAWSKLWFRIGFTEIHGHHEQPDQRYFMNHGPYASDRSWLVHLVAAVLTVIAVKWLLGARREASRAP
jgi:hypothetical protein